MFHSFLCLCIEKDKFQIHECDNSDDVNSDTFFLSDILYWTLSQ